MNIQNFIEKEKLYFEPMFQRQMKYSASDLERFRAETVSERRLRVSKEMFDYCKGMVLYGPFRGLKLTDSPFWGGNDLGAMCFGFYEKELLEFLCSDILSNRDIFIDIGAADGYYAIGLLGSKRVETAICFELTQEGRNTIKVNHDLNERPGVLSIYGDVLTDFRKGVKDVDFSKATVLVDIEGLEFEFLSREILTIMRSAVIVIEIHNWIPSFFNLYSTFLKNASEFFQIEILEKKERDTFAITELRSLTDDNRLLLTSESRPCVMRFLTLTPK